jgi:hypothetical protein
MDVHADVAVSADCKNLQDVPEQASTIGIDWQSGGKADPDFPGSAAMCRRWSRPVTPEFMAGLLSRG